MCGLTGFIAQSNKKQINKTTFTLLMATNDKRGGDSTGFYDGKNFTKCLGTSAGLYDKMQNLESSFVIGHTRKSTHGKTNLPNQHPFQYGNVVGAHNGVLRNYKEVGKKHNLKETIVDSQMIFKLLNKTQDVKCLGQFSGALATLFTMGDGKLYTYRHNNPLYVGKDNEDNAYFSSLKEPLEYAGLKNIFQLKEDRVYVWENGQVIDKIDIIQKPVPQAIKPMTYANYGGYYWQDQIGKRNKKKNKKSKATKVSKGHQLSLTTQSADTNDDLYGWGDEIDTYNAGFNVSTVDDPHYEELEDNLSKLEKVNKEYGIMFDYETKNQMIEVEQYLKDLSESYLS
jgi:hypothetical protein